MVPRGDENLVISKELTMISLSLGPMFREAGGGGRKAEGDRGPWRKSLGFSLSAGKVWGRSLLGERKRVVCLQERSG